MINANTTSTDKCDFCDADVTFVKRYDEHGIGNWFEGVDGGSDWVAIWCQACGPKHRK